MLECQNMATTNLAIADLGFDMDINNFDLLFMHISITFGHKNGPCA